MKNHIMIDLETLGTTPGCAILSIGAVVFHPEQGTLGAEFYCVVNTDSCTDHFLEIDPSTVDWWSKQTPEARTVLDEATMSGLPLAEALRRFNSFLDSVGPKKDNLIYGNGADFDNPILYVAYAAAKVDSRMPPYGGRCYRTLKQLDELFGARFAAHKLHRTGVHHNALDDAKAQAHHLMEIVDAIRSDPRPQGEES